MIDTLLSFLIKLTIKKNKFHFCLKLGNRVKDKHKIRIQIKIYILMKHQHTCLHDCITVMDIYFFSTGIYFYFNMFKRLRIITKDKNCGHNSFRFLFLDRTEV